LFLLEAGFFSCSFNFGFDFCHFQGDLFFGLDSTLVTTLFINGHAPMLVLDFLFHLMRSLQAEICCRDAGFNQTLFNVIKFRVEL
jgi:hypothetical protein